MVLEKCGPDFCFKSPINLKDSGTYTPFTKGCVKRGKNN